MTEVWTSQPNGSMMHGGFGEEWQALQCGNMDLTHSEVAGPANLSLSISLG